MAPRVEWVTDPAAFGELEPHWDRLLPADPSPFDLHCWYAAWWEAFGAGELAVCTAWRAEELVAALPLAAAASRLRGLANSHSASFRPLARDDEAMTALGSAATERGHGFELVGVPAGDAAVAPLSEGVRTASGILLAEPSYASPAVETGGELDAWRSQSKPRWGAPLERFRRKMGRDFEARFAIVEPPEDLERELSEGFRVEASGWKGRAGTAIVSRPETEAFYRGLAAAFERRGELRLSRIELDGVAVAFDLCLLHGGRLYLLKTGFDEEFRRLAPGLVMRLAVIERCFELGLRSHELLGSESEWKAKFQTTTRQHSTLHAYRRGPVGIARYAYRKALRPRLRGAYRRLRSRGG